MGTLSSYSPITLEEVGTVDTIDSSDLDRIIRESRDAQRIWGGYSKERKLSLFKGLRDRMSESIEEIAFVIYSETGKPKADILSTEMMSSVATVKYCEDWMRSWKSSEKVDQRSLSLMLKLLGRRSHVEYTPLGIIGIISPFNFPFAIPFTETAMAVAAGNSVILKPSSSTPLSGRMVETMFERSGFPKGLVRAVFGKGVGEALTSSPVDKIIFTGGGDAGRKVMSACSSRMTPSIMELGGKDAMIVMEDADVERAVSCAIWASFVNSGQVCAGVKRIFVHSSVYEEFEGLIVAGTRELKQGDGWDDPDVSVGPLMDQNALDSMDSVCSEVKMEGGEILTGGRRNPSLKGYFFEPTVVKGLDAHSDLADKEIFGPVVMLFPFSSDEEAIEMANSGEFALGSSVWTSDLVKGRAIASCLRAGTTDINNATYTYGLPATPWGGRDRSGYGTTHGEAGFMELMHAHHVHKDKGRYREDIWWMPYSAEKTETLERMLRMVFCRNKMPLGLMIDVRKIMNGKSRR